MGEILKARRKNSSDRLESLRQELRDAEELAGSNACVYLTGSFARGEASEHSDLDLFIVGKGTQEPAAEPCTGKARNETAANRNQYVDCGATYARP